MSREFFTHNDGMSSMSCMPRMSWMSWPRLQPRRRLFVAATSAPSEPWSFVLFLLLFRCVCVCSFHYADSLPICVFVWVAKGGGPRRTKEGKEECSRTSVTRRFRVPGPKTVANFWGPHDVSTLLLPVFGILLFYTAKNA